jgi:tetratricopeptide (TPR) repeat protein
VKRRAAEALLCLGLALLCVAAFHAVGENGFVSVDDDVLVVDNPFVNSGLRLENVRRAFLMPYASNWAPLSWLSHMLDCSLFGLDPRPHHLMNLALHTLDTLLLFLVLASMTRDPTKPDRLDSLWPSALVGALFAVHPTRVESVAWIAERRDVLSTAFWILAMGAYASYARRPDSSRASRRYVTACVLFGLGLMAKPMLVSLPFVLLLLDWWPLGRIDVASLERNPWRELRPLLVEKLPMFALSAAVCGITVFSQAAGGSMEPLDVVPLGDRIANAIVSYARYLRLLVWPSGLAVLYPRLPSEALGLSWRVLGSGGLLLGVTLLVLHQRRVRPYLAVGWFWFVGTLVPVIGLLQVGQQAMADRYTYVPYVGLFIALAWEGERAARSRVRAMALGAVAAVAIVAFVAVTWRQVGYWKDGTSLIERAIAVTEDNATAYQEMSALHYAAGRLEQAVALNNLGNALRALHRTAEAEPFYARALELAPGLVTVRVNLALARLDRGEYADAVDLLGAAFDADPKLTQQSILVRAYTWSLRKQLDDREVSLDEAAGDYRKALKQLPQREDLVDELIWILATHPDATVEDGREALELARTRRPPNGDVSAVGLDRLAVACAAAGRFDEAVAAAEQALERVGDGGSAYFVEGVRERLALYRAGRPYRDHERWLSRPPSALGAERAPSANNGG